MAASNLSNLIILAVTLACGLVVLHLVSRKTPSTSVKKQAAKTWESLSDTPLPSTSGEAHVDPQASVPADFDVKNFLDGARMAYSRLQTAWAARDVDVIAPLVTPAMLERVREQVRKNPEPRHMEVVVVHATLLDVSRTAEEESVTLLFDGLLREEDRSVDARENWRFVRTLRPEGMWLLDTIGSAHDRNDSAA